MSLLDMSVAGGVVILAVIVLRALGQNRLPKATFTVLWTVALLRLFIPAAVPSAVSVYAWFPPQAEAAETAPAAVTPAPAEDRPAVLPAADRGPSEAAEQVSPAARDAAAIPWRTVLWAAGALGCGGFFAGAYVHSRRKFREAVAAEDGFVRRWQESHPLHRRVSVRLSGRVDAPMTYGLFRPVILLPAGLDWRDEKGLGFILAHEYGHIRRLDGLRKLVLTAAVCLHWFNPLVWAMFILANRDMEMACDEQVVRAMETHTRADYARTLIRMEEARAGLMPLVSHFSANAMEERITAIMKSRKLTAWAVVLSLILTMGVTAVFATGAPEEVAPEDGTPAPTPVPDLAGEEPSPDWLDWLGEDPLSFKVFYNGVPYQLPAPVEDFAANGWTVTEGAGRTVAPGESFPIALTLSEAGEDEGADWTLETRVRNYSNEALPAEDCYVTYVGGGAGAAGVSIVVPAPGTGIAWGMPGRELIRALRGMDYTLDEDGDGLCYTLANDDGSIVIRATGKDIQVTGIQVTCEPDGAAAPEEPAETPVPPPIEDLKARYVWDLTGGSGVAYEENASGEADYLLDIRPYGYRAPVNFAYIRGGQSFNGPLQPGAAAVVGSAEGAYETLLIVHDEGQITMGQRSLDGGEENPVGGQTLNVKDGDIITGSNYWTVDGGTEFYVRNTGGTELRIDAFLYDT